MLPIIEQVTHPVSGREYSAALCGSVAPLFTPERLDGRIDFDGLELLADHLCSKSSVSALVVRSWEGRLWAYSHEEVRDAIRCVVSVAKGRKPVIAGCAGIWNGDFNERPRPAVYFRAAADLSQWALASGAAAVLQPVPVMLQPGYDFGPQDVVLRFFEDMARAVKGPIVIYNQATLPQGWSLTPQSLERLSRLKEMVGVIYDTKDTSLIGNIVRCCEERFAVIGANEALTLPGFSTGTTGVAGLLATVLPELIDSAWQSLREPNLPFAYRAQNDLLASQELLGQWPAGDIGCSLFAHQGINMASRNREGGRTPLQHEVQDLIRKLSYMRAAYM